MLVLFAIPFSVGHILSEPSTITHLSCVALHGTTHSFPDLDKAVIHVPLVSLIILKRSLVFPTIVFLYCFALITEEDFLIPPRYSLDLCTQMGISFLFSFAFHFFFFFTAICKASSESHFDFFAFIFLGDDLAPCLLYNVMNLHP